MTAEKIEALARRIVKSIREDKRHIPRTATYMVNINHPAVLALYKKWRADTGNIWYAPSDLERTRFELQLFNQQTLEKLAAYMDADTKAEETKPPK